MLELVVPCYNESRRLKPDAFLHALAASDGLAFLFVDDGSVDATPALLAGLVDKGNGRVHVLTLKANAGKARAVQLGVLAAFERNPEFTGYWDADLATPLGAIPDLMQIFATRPEVEIVIGSRVKLLGREVSRSLLRHYSGRVFATAASFALGIPVYDTQCGAKIFRTTSGVRQIFATPFRSAWIFDVEILARFIASVGRTGAVSRIYEVPLAAWTAMDGSKLTLRHAIRAAWDLIVISRR